MTPCKNLKHGVYVSQVVIIIIVHLPPALSLRLIKQVVAFIADLTAMEVGKTEAIIKLRVKAS